MNRALLAAMSCALAAFLAIGWWLLQRPAEVAPGTTPAGTVAAAPRDAVPASAAEPMERPAATPAATERTVAESVAAPETTDRAETRRLEGTIVVADADGSVHDDCDGFVELHAMVPFHADNDVYELRSSTAPVAGGRWHADVPTEATKLQVGTVHLDERPALCTEEFPLTADMAPLLLQARWVPALRLRVVGDDTGADLGGLRVVRCSDWRRDDFRHPGNEELRIVLEHGRSPLQLHHGETGPSVRYWVKAPGYAWDQIVLATDGSGERTLRLAPGGDVDVTFVGAVPAGAVLRVREVRDEGHAPPGLPRRQDQPVAEVTLAAAGATRIDALPAGSWSLSLEKGDWFREQVVFGTATVVATAGAIVPATITVRADMQPPVAQRVHGTLQLSPAWGEDIHLELEATGANKVWARDDVRLRLDGMQPIGPGHYRWGEIELLAGRWEITVRGTEYRTIAEVGPGLPNALHIVVPDPNEVRVRVVDATTGVPIPDAEPGWYGTVAGWSSGWGHSRMHAVGDDWYRCLAPAGTIVLSVHPEGYSWLHASHEVRPGGNEFVLRLQRVCGIELELKDGEVTIPWPDDAHAQLEHTTSKAGVAYWSGHRVAAKEPGEHLLTIEPIPGYEPIAPRTVQIEAGRWTKVEIGLRRKP